MQTRQACLHRGERAGVRRPLEPPGTTIVHTAQSQSLAALEMLVHLDSPELLEKYVLLAVEIEEALITSVESSRLPRNWRADPPAKVRAIGDEWVFSGGSAVRRGSQRAVSGRE